MTLRIVPRPHAQSRISNFGGPFGPLEFAQACYAEGSRCERLSTAARRMPDASVRNDRENSGNPLGPPHSRQPLTERSTEPSIPDPANYLQPTMADFSLRRIASTARAARAWRPAALSVLKNGVMSRRRNDVAGFTDSDHLRFAAQWLLQAQDASSDGGVAGRYTLSRGWTSSYPETTGYIVPTLLALESEGFAGCKDRAARCIDFLLGVQLSSGAFPGMEIEENREEPSVFNTAQILNGLTAWHSATQDERTLLAARRAADWLVATQESDGAWRKHLYGNRTYTYMAHAGCWLAEFGAHVADQRYLNSAASHLEWVLGHVNPETGWINDCGFGDDSDGQCAVTHTIAYTIWGILLMSQLLHDDRGIAVARRAALAVARRLEVSRWLPGKLDWRWRARASYACLTGNAQMALIWLELHRLDWDPALLSAACKAIDLVKAAQPMTANDYGIRGGIGGSDPIWGDYIPLAYPNWAAKFFIDALLAKRNAIAALAESARSRGFTRDVPPDVPRELPTSVPLRDNKLRIVMLSSERSPKVEQFFEAWSSWGFQPTAVVCTQEMSPTVSERVLGYLRDFGFRSLLLRIIGRRTVPAPEPPRQGTIPTSGASVPEYCAEHGIPVISVSDLKASTNLEQVRAIGADVFVYAGCGILRRATLDLARLGTLNAHMGLLPVMRGMNVAEWSVLYGVPTGCTVHLIDDGIDTGDIIAFHAVNPDGAITIDQLRQLVDRAQIALLGDVVRWTVRDGVLPPRRSQRSDEGRQFFAMHDDVRNELQRVLADRARKSPAREADAGLVA
jgi:folate-dependent phosphoribosylglycinamide formyltransferase PurN